ncbi:MAG: indole-3-glycerol phosphate synthase TrpC [Pyrinomonadaceae bacterium]
MNGQPSILQKIFEKKKIRVDQAKRGFGYEEFVRRAKSFRKDRTKFRFSSAFSDSSKINIIAEIKRASPSKGMINDLFSVDDVARDYQKFGAAAISVLTEEDFFKGRIEDLITARNLTDLPILRKDFVFDEFQVYESALIGADAILLIAAMLNDEEIQRLYSLAESLGLDVLIETHNFMELERAAGLGAKLIGVNNRDLHTFEVSLDVSRNLVKKKPDNALFICESGLSRKEDLIEMQSLGFDGFLIGESLMKANNIGEAFASLL